VSIYYRQKNLWPQNVADDRTLQPSKWPTHTRATKKTLFIAQTPVSFGLIISNHHFLEPHFDQKKRKREFVHLFSFSLVLPV
jgi:hypothetical protein